jgi:hypothetical protein
MSCVLPNADGKLPGIFGDCNLNLHFCNLSSVSQNFTHDVLWVRIL